MVQSVVKFAFIGVIIVFVVGILGTAVFSWTLDTSPYLQGLTNFLHVIYYVLPMGKLSPIILSRREYLLFWDHIYFKDI